MSRTSNSSSGEKARVNVELSAENFGCDAKIYNKNQRISREICGVKNFHHKKDLMRNAVICLETSQIFRGITDALKYIDKVTETSKDEDSLPRTLVIFEGKYLIENTIEINRDNVILFGVEGSNQPDSFVYLSRGRYESKGEFMFKLGVNVKKLYFHNIRFNPKEKIAGVTKDDCTIFANLCVMGHVEDLKKNSVQPCLVETNHSWSLDLDGLEK